MLNILVFVYPNLKYGGKNTEANTHTDVITTTMSTSEMELLYIESPNILPIYPINIE